MLRGRARDVSSQDSNRVVHRRATLRKTVATWVESNGVKRGRLLPDNRLGVSASPVATLGDLGKGER